MMRWTGLAPREFELSFPGSLTSTFPGDAHAADTGVGGVRRAHVPLLLLAREGRIKHRLPDSRFPVEVLLLSTQPEFRVKCFFVTCSRASNREEVERLR